MSQSRLIARLASPGATLRLLLTNGQEVHAKLEETGDGYVLVTIDNGLMSLTDALLGGFEVLGTPGDVPGSAAMSVPRPPPPAGAVINGHTAVDHMPVVAPAPPPDEPLDPAQRVRLGQIEGRFEEALKRTPVPTPGPILDLPAVDWNRDDTLALERTWRAMTDKYAYAKKVKEPLRYRAILGAIVAASRQLPPSAALEYNAGWFALGVRHQSARDHFLRAAQLGEPFAFLHLAAMDGSKRPIAAQWALERFFRDRPVPSQQPEAFKALLNLTLRLRNVALLKDLAQAAAADEFLLESVVYVIHRCFDGDVARSSSLLKNLLDSDRPPDANVLFGALDAAQEASPVLEEHAAKLSARRRALDTELSDTAREHARIAQLLTEALSHKAEGDILAAQRAINAVLRVDPQNDRAQRMLQETRSKGPALPSGRNPYARAKRAEHTDRDPAAQERYLRESIAAGDSLESAVKDLALLLDRTERGAEAIDLLDAHADRMSDKIALSNVRAQLLIRLHRAHEAVEDLKKVLRLELPMRQPAVTRRIAQAQIAAQQYDDAESTLRSLLERIEDPKAEELLATLTRARETNTYDEIDATIAKMELPAYTGQGLSSLVAFNLERCTFAGLDAAVVAGETFSEKDVAGLERQARSRVARPRERADYNLTAARILRDSGAQDDRFRDSLRGFTAAMGDALVLGSNELDVARAYYTETVTLSREWDALVSVKLGQLVMSFYSSRERLLQPNTPQIEECILTALEDEETLQAITEGLLVVASMNRGIGEQLIKRLSQNVRVRGAVIDACRRYLGKTERGDNTYRVLLEVWPEAIDNLLARFDELDSEFRYLRGLATDLGSLQQQIEHLAKIHARAQAEVTDQQRLVLNPLEVRRVKRLGELLEHVAEYTKQTSYHYLERERLFSRIQTMFTELIEQIELLPTRLCFDALHPYITVLRDSVTTHFGRLEAASLPTELDVALAIESYVPDDDNCIDVQATVANKPDRSPAARVEIVIEPSLGHEYEALLPRLSVRESISGGDKVPVKIPLRVSARALREKVFTLRVNVTFRTRLGSDLEQREVSLPISLYDPSRFEAIDPNPYNKWAQGTAVTDSRMFFGRDVLIRSLAEAVQHGASRSLVIYGQKRAGKSSVLHHLRESLRPPVIPIKFSMGSLSMMGSTRASGIVYLICQAIDQELQAHESAESGSWTPPEVPAFADVDANPFLIFDYLNKVRSTLDSGPFPDGTRIVLLIDEFTKIYGAICRGELHDGFMATWKAMLENEYFTCVLVGQDVMQQFINRFPNEFQVARPLRVSYLDRQAADALITEPTRMLQSGETRFRGTAVEHIFDLTAGSPYYIQIFCNRLVDYMNDKRAIWVADAHVEEVLHDLVTGPDSLRKDAFDNLVYPGDEGMARFDGKDTESVLAECARQTRSQKWVERAALEVVTTCSLNELLDDLVGREVLERTERRYRIRVGLFREWLLANELGLP